MTVLIVGIGHVFDLRARLHSAAADFRPSAIALEIDPLRFQALRDPSLRGRPPLTYRMLAYLQRRIASSYSTTPGKEMLDAYDAAGVVGADVFMIDMDARVLLTRLRRAMPLRRRLKLFATALLGVIGVGRGRSVEQELDEFDRDPAKFFDVLEAEYPELKRVLVDERDELMASRVRYLSGRYPRVMVVVGDAHVPGMQARLADLGPDVVRLRDLRRGAASPERDGSLTVEGHEVSFSVDVGDPWKDEGRG